MNPTTAAEIPTRDAFDAEQEEKHSLIFSTIWDMLIAQTGTVGSPYRFLGDHIQGNYGRVFPVRKEHIAGGNDTAANFSIVEDEPLSDEDFVAAANPHRSIIWRIPRRIELSAYVEIPTDPGRRHEPIVKGKGVPIWSLIAYVEKRELTPDEVSKLWNGYITTDEVIAALLYKKEHPEAVEDRLEDES